MTRYRPHRGALADAMREVREVASWAELQRHVSPFVIASIERYSGPDPRIGWDETYVVCGRLPPDETLYVLGFTDGPLSSIVIL